eukprot:11664601-Alexandrium_andersonii.AAC.1
MSASIGLARLWTLSSLRCAATGSPRTVRWGVFAPGVSYWTVGCRSATYRTMAARRGPSLR